MGKRPSNESQDHYELKSVAKKFLSGFGYSPIYFEAQLGKRPNGVRSDVIGEKDGLMAVVECGGSSRDKLLRLAKLVDFVYILPYGQKKPFLWNDHLLICQNCGHIKKISKANW